MGGNLLRKPSASGQCEASFFAGRRAGKQTSRTNEKRTKSRERERERGNRLNYERRAHSRCCSLSPVASRRSPSDGGQFPDLHDCKKSLARVGRARCRPGPARHPVKRARFAQKLINCQLGQLGLLLAVAAVVTLALANERGRKHQCPLSAHSIACSSATKEERARRRQLGLCEKSSGQQQAATTMAEEERRPRKKKRRRSFACSHVGARKVDLSARPARAQVRFPPALRALETRRSQ